MANADDIELYATDSEASSDGGAVTSGTADSGATTTLTDNALTQVDDFWNGSVLEITAGTNSGEKRWVTDFAASTDTITVNTAFSAAIDNTSQYKLTRAVGGYRSAEQLADIASTAPTNCTGCTVAFVGGENGTGNGTLRYSFDNDTLSWQAPSSSTEGAEVDISAGNGTYTMYDGDDTNDYIDITVVDASLAGSNKSDTLTLSRNTYVLFDDVTGDEANAGMTDYKAIVIKHNATFVSEVFWVNPFCTDTAVDMAGGYAASGAITVTSDDASSFPSSGYIQNETTNEVMYFSSRTATVFTIPAVGRGARGSSASAGANNEVIRWYPNFDYAGEAPDVQPSATGGLFTECGASGDNGAPSGITFTTYTNPPLTKATGISVAASTSGDIYAIWAKRPIVAGAAMDTDLYDQWYIEGE